MAASADAAQSTMGMTPSPEVSAEVDGVRLQDVRVSIRFGRHIGGGSEHDFVPISTWMGSAFDHEGGVIDINYVIA